MQSTGSLFIVSTPIGNLEDITIRAIGTLQKADIIACEDTRKSRILLNKYNIKKQLISFHKYSEAQKYTRIIDSLKRGMNIALITDAGTPGISDPGAYLVKQVMKNDIKVVPIPGPSALACAVSISGVSEPVFVFIGFMPSGLSDKKDIIKKYFSLGIPVVFYETPKRLLNTVKLMRSILNEATVLVFKELTKIHEEIIYGDIGEVLNKLEHSTIKGEYTVIAECKNYKADTEKIVQDKKLLLKMASAVTGLDKREIYKRLFRKVG